jgi:hypothetical protein
MGRLPALLLTADWVDFEVSVVSFFEVDPFFEMVLIASRPSSCSPA